MTKSGLTGDEARHARTGLGSGTTLIAAERTGRCCYGLEIDPTYVDTIIRRWHPFAAIEAEGTRHVH